MNYLKIIFLVIFIIGCKDDISYPPGLWALHEHIQVIKDNQDLLQKLELSEDKNLAGMILKHQYQLQVFFNGKERKDYPSDLYVKKGNAPFHYLEFITNLDWEYEYPDLQITYNCTEYKLKCPLLFEDELFHSIQIAFTLGNGQVNRTQITLDGREGKILQQDNESSLSLITP